MSSAPSWAPNPNNMPLTPAEQRELDMLELRELEAKAAGFAPAGPRQAPGDNHPQIGYNSKASEAEAAARSLAARHQVATGMRVGGPLYGMTLSPLGVVAGAGAGEKAAQMLEGGPQDSGAIGKALAVNAVPIAKAGGIMGLIKNILGQGAAGAAGEGIREAVNGEKMNPGAMAMSAAPGVGGSIVAPAVGAVAGKLMNRVSPEEVAHIAAMKLNNAEADKTLAAITSKGGVAVPSSVNPSAKNKALESLAGIQNVEGEVARSNAPVFNAMGRREAGIPANQPINAANLEAGRDEIARTSYGAARLAGFGDELNNWRDAATKLRDAQRELDRGFTNARGAAVDEAADALGKADYALNKVTGNPDAVKIVEDAKRAFAKNYDVEAATPTGTGRISPAILAQMEANRKAGGMTGELLDMAKFQNEFGRSAKNPAKMATAPGAASAMAPAMLVAGAPTAAQAMVGGIPLLRGPVARMLASPGYQAKNAVRNYTPNTSADPAVVSAVIAALRNLQSRTNVAPARQ